MAKKTVADIDVKGKRVLNSGHWKNIATAIETEATSVDQSRGKNIEYCVIAINKSGVGSPSNMVMVVL